LPSAERASDVTTCRDKSSRDVTHTLSVYILCLTPIWNRGTRGDVRAATTRTVCVAAGAIAQAGARPSCLQRGNATHSVDPKHRWATPFINAVVPAAGTPRRRRTYARSCPRRRRGCPSRSRRGHRAGRSRRPRRRPRRPRRQTRPRRRPRRLIPRARASPAARRRACRHSEAIRSTQKLSEAISPAARRRV